MLNERKAGAVLSYVYIAVNTLIMLVYQPILLRMLGTSEFGLYQLAASVINYLTVMDFGFGNGIVVYTAKYHESGKFDAERKLHGMFAIIYWGIGLVAAAIGLTVAFNVDIIFAASLTAGEIGKCKILMLILTANMALTFPLSIYSNIIIAYEKFIFSKVASILRVLLTPMMMLPLLMFGADSVVLVSILSAVNIGILLANMFFCTKKLGVKVGFAGFDRVIFKEIFSYSVFIFIAEIVDKVNWVVDQMILGITCGTSEVTVYSMASNYNQMVLILSGALSGVMLPKISKMVTRKAPDSELNREFIKTSRLQILTIFLVASGFALFGQKFVIWHAGEECRNSYWVALILILASAIPITQSIAINIVKAKNLFKFRAYMLLAMAIANVGISIPLALRFGSIGSALGTAIALVVANIIIINIYYHKRCGIDMIEYWKTASVMTVKMLPSMAITYALKSFIQIDGLGELIVFAPIYVILYCASSYLFIMDDYEKGLIKKISGKLRRR